MKETRPAPELLLAQLILSAFIVGLLGHATYVKDVQVLTYHFEILDGRPIFVPGRIKDVPVNEFRASHGVLFQLTVGSAYFFANLLLYITCKTLKDPILYTTNIIMLQDLVFCVLMFACSFVAVMSSRSETGNKETEILIASGVSMFCCVSSGVGVYYSYKVYTKDSDRKLIRLVLNNFSL